MRLQDKVSVITGAASGIGKASALLFAKEGSKVVVSDIQEEEGQVTAKFIKASGGEAAFFRADITKKDEVESMVKFACETYGKIDVLFNNAGVFWPSKDTLITEVAEEVWDRIIEINLKGAFLCCKYGIPELIKGGGGSIINTSSVAGIIASERSGYAVSKAGLIALTRSIARQFAKWNIRANAICPGMVDTPLLRGLDSAGPTQFPLGTSLIPRYATPDEIAYVAVYLASDESAYSTGAIFVVDGGWSMI